jgi:enoyl-CoA hydratase
VTLVRRDDRDGIATLTLDRPEKRNALNVAMFAALDAHLAAIEAEGDRIGLVMLRAAGPVFCAGADLGPREETPVPNFQARTIARLAALPQPVIAAVHGDCLTGGLELILAADLIVAAESAGFADTHARWAVVPVWGMTPRLPRRIGQGRARWLAFTGRRIDAATAERWGLVDQCIADAAFDAGVDALAADIARQSWHSLRGYKRLYRDTEDLPLAEALAWEIERSPGNGPDFRDRVAGRFGSPSGGISKGAG